MGHSTKLFIPALLFLLSFLANAKTTKTPSIQSGKLQFQVIQSPTSEPQLFRVNYDSSVKSQLKLTQSSKINIEAKMNFGSQSFDPELFSFRLVHAKYDKLTQPVQVVYDSDTQTWKCTIDIGDPRTIQPYSDVYKLELIIADEKLAKNVRNVVGTVRISFRHSINEQKIPNNNTPINYNLPNIIRTNPPEERIDPPATFTIFVVIIMGVFTVIFFYGLFGHLKINLNLLPSDGLGLLLNIGLIGLLGANLVFLAKFWLHWNFITTITNLFWLVSATAIVANYALLYLKGKI